MMNSSKKTSGGITENDGSYEFRQMFLGEWVHHCDIIDNKGNHCPEKPEHFFEYRGKEVGLCKKCFILYKEGAFDSAKKYGHYLRIK